MALKNYLLTPRGEGKEIVILVCVTKQKLDYIFTFFKVS